MKVNLKIVILLGLIQAILLTLLGLWFLLAGRSPDKQPVVIPAPPASFVA